MPLCAPPFQPHSGGPIAVDYRLEQTAQGWKIYDLNVEGIWLIQNYRNQFAQEINRNGIDGLIDALNQRNEPVTPGTGAPAASAREGQGGFPGRACLTRRSRAARLPRLMRFTPRRAASPTAYNGTMAPLRGRLFLPAHARPQPGTHPQNLRPAPAATWR